LTFAGAASAASVPGIAGLLQMELSGMTSFMPGTI
jgi:hypothetical protein